RRHARRGRTGRRTRLRQRRHPQRHPVERPFVFIRHLDPEIARATWSIYQPAVPTTLEGLLYALAGVVCALTLYYGAIKYPTLAVLRARRARKTGATS